MRIKEDEIFKNAEKNDIAIQDNGKKKWQNK